MYLVGAVILIAAPVRARAWIFVVLQVNAALSCLVPLLYLSAMYEMSLRLVITYAGIGVLCALGDVKADCFWKVLPWHWAPTLAGRYGAVQTCILGSEFLGWGYALMATNEVIAYGLIFTGGIYLTRFSWMGMKDNLPLARPWFRLNVIYAVGNGLNTIVLAIALL